MEAKAWPSVWNLHHLENCSEVNEEGIEILKSKNPYTVFEKGSVGAGDYAFHFRNHIYRHEDVFNFAGHWAFHDPDTNHYLVFKSNTDENGELKSFYKVFTAVEKIKKDEPAIVGECEMRAFNVRHHFPNEDGSVSTGIVNGKSNSISWSEYRMIYPHLPSKPF